jgi:hypothetical protein
MRRKNHHPLCGHLLLMGLLACLLLCCGDSQQFTEPAGSLAGLKQVLHPGYDDEVILPIQDTLTRSMIPQRALGFGWFMDAALDAGDRLHLAASDARHGRVVYAQLQDGEPAWEYPVPYGGSGRYLSMALDDEGGVHLVVNRQGQQGQDEEGRSFRVAEVLLYAWKTNDTWQYVTLDTGAEAGYGSRLYVHAPTRTLHLIYFINQGGGRLKHAFRPLDDPRWTIQVLEESSGFYQGVNVLASDHEGHLRMAVSVSRGIRHALVGGVLNQDGTWQLETISEAFSPGLKTSFAVASDTWYLSYVNVRSELWVARPRADGRGLQHRLLAKQVRAHDLRYHRGRLFLSFQHRERMSREESLRLAVLDPDTLTGEVWSVDEKGPVATWHKLLPHRNGDLQLVYYDDKTMGLMYFITGKWR